MTCKDCVHYDACEEMYEAYKQDSIDWDRDFGDCGFSSCCNHFKNKADFVEVKHGECLVDEFKRQNKKFLICSECRAVIDCNVICIDENEFDYCPYCGVDMRKEGADNG